MMILFSAITNAEGGSFDSFDVDINEEIRLDRLRKLYPDNFQDHIKNMSHLSEKGQLNFKNKKNVMYINSNDSLENIKYNIKYFINNYK